MTADLQQINEKHHNTLTTTQFSSKISKTIACLFIFIFVTISVGTWYALYQNWTVRVEIAHSRLVRSANMANFLIESALASAAKSLDSTQTAFSKAIQSDQMNQALASQILKTSYAKFQAFNKTDVFGLLFFVDKNGKLYAQSSGHANTDLDFSDRLYFYQPRDNPDIHQTVGPLVFARTTGKWVFHLSVPVRGKNGEFAGVLVQQILEADIANKLMHYADPSHFERLMAHIEDSEPSFVFPPPNTADAPSKEFLAALAHNNSNMTSPAIGNEDQLMDSAKSPTYELVTYATFPLSRVRYEFLAGNKYLMLYAFLGLLFSTAIFSYLHAMSKKLTAAQISSMHDPLTQLHNRRALDELLPALLRESKRSQTPISVLFIDIDYFRYFNENYGHESGDVALKAVAETISSCIHRPLDFVCRWGGEEFVVVLPKTNRNAAQKIAGDILAAVREIQLQCTNGDHPQLTVSIGHVTSVLNTNLFEEDLVDEADKAMLQAKAQGRNRHVEYMFNA